MEQTYELRQSYARERSTLEQAVNSAQAETALARQQSLQWHREWQQAQQQREAIATKLAAAEASLQVKTAQLQTLQQQWHLMMKTGES